MVRMQGATRVGVNVPMRGQVKTAPETWISPLAGNMPIHFGDGALDLLPSFLEELRPDKVFIVSDHHVFDIHGAFLLQLLPGDLAPEVIRIPEGEGEKNLASLELIARELFERGATKSSVVVNFGGGVVLNVGGLAASLCYRGLRFVHVPTTMMAQSDVIVSNKQGVNFAGGKNRLGLFSTPMAAFADPRLCATEPMRQLRAALVEYAKNALILGGAHYGAAMAFFEDGDPLSPANLRRLLRSSLEQKFEIARLDPTEREFGMVLEYGHTVGHAVECLSQGRVLHGEGVYHGMNVAGRLANAMGLLPDAEFKNQSLLLGRIRGIPGIPADISVGQILKAVQHDNKKKDANLAFILLQAVGRPHRSGPTVLTSVPEETLRLALLEYRDALL